MTLAIILVYFAINSNSMEAYVDGRTKLKVGLLGVAGGYSAPAKVFEEAFYLAFSDQKVV